MKRVLVVFGTRPEAIKLAPLVAALRAGGRYRIRLLATAQHREMLDQALTTFGLTADRDLDLCEPGQTLDSITSRAVTELQPVLREERPDLVVVQGDTTTAFAAALSAFYARVPVGHVEAGLRTGDVGRPFPEEMNRRLISQLATLHFAPTRVAARRLEAQGVDRGHIWLTGNTVVDALRWALEQPVHLPVAVDPGRPLLLVTAHRRESWGEGLAAIGRAIVDLATSRPDLQVVFPMHRNPTVRQAMRRWIADRDNVSLLEPLPYVEFVHLMQRATVILTDSGGVQEEAPSLGVPVLVVRDVTERPEGIEEGAARLVGLDPVRIVAEVGRIIDEPGFDQHGRDRAAVAANPYGDGQASDRIVAAIDGFLGSAAP